VWPSGVHVPVIWPALLAASLLAWTQALTWMSYPLRGLRVIITVLWLTVIGISYFWFLGSLLQLVTVLFGTQVLKLDGRWIGLLTAFSLHRGATSGILALP